MTGASFAAYAFGGKEYFISPMGLFNRIKAAGLGKNSSSSQKITGEFSTMNSVEEKNANEIPDSG